MDTRFAPDANKLNPKFEGYKLSPFKEATNVIRIPLDSIQLYQSTNDQRLGFRDLQARIRHSHLIYGHPLDKNRGASFCIDQEFNLYNIVYNKLTREIKHYLITQLIKPLGGIPAFIEPNNNVPIEPQLPSAISVSRELLLASNGVGDIELIGLEEKDGTVLGTSLASLCYLGAENEGISPVPCVLLAARQIKTKIILVVYSRTASKTTEFNIATLELDIPTEDTKRLDDGSFALLLRTLHIQTGPEVPVYCAITPMGKAVFGSEVRYNKVKQPKDEGNEEGDATPMDIVQEPEQQSSKQPPYEWTQEGADITVQFRLPENTSKTAINCKFVVDHLSLLVQNSKVSYPFRKLWSTIQPDESLWTLQDNTLTLCMTKVDENTRWPQLFDKDDGIMETLSEHHLSEIKGRLAKFTSEDSAGLVPNPSFAQAAQHPAATDMDEDIDEAGEPIVFSVYDSAGNVVDEFNTGTYRWLCSSFETAHQLPSVCLQMDVDGLVFTLKEDQDKIQVQHVTSFDAFAFVQASKRDARFTHHDPQFHFASIIESSRNAYLYYHHNDKRLEEVQTLVDLTQGHDVDVIGAQLLLESDLMILTESHLILIILDQQD